MKIPGGFDALFRQLTPLFLLGVLVTALFEPWLPGAAWLRENLGETVVLRACVAALVLYVLLLWGESLRLHTILTGVLQAFRQHSEGSQSTANSTAAKNPKARLEAARLLIAAMGSDDADIRETSHHNLVRLVGRDLGGDPAAWRDWLRQQDSGDSGKTP